MKKIAISLLILVMLSAVPGSPGNIFSNVPKTIDTHARYLIYLHGRIIETSGRRPTHPRFGVYEYDRILQAFADSGFVVISEARPADTRALDYARKVVAQIDTLLRQGVAPSRITVVGASKGAAIAGFVSALLKNPQVRFVLLAICNKRTVNVWVNQAGPFYGKVLYIYERSDRIGRSCQPFLSQLKSDGLTAFKEIELNTGLQHGFLYRPLPEWVNPTVEWAKHP